MSAKTDHTSEISLVVRQWLIVLTLLTGVLVFLTERHVQRSMEIDPEFKFTLHPWHYAAGLTIFNGLNLFSGKPPALLSQGQQITVITGLLLSLVLAPTALLFGWRHSFQRKQRGMGSSAMMVPVFILGGVLTIAALFPSVPFTILQSRAYRSMQEAQDLGTHRDMLIDHLNGIARNARQYRILPSRFGGGNGSFQNYEIPSSMRDSEDGTFTIAETGEEKLLLKATSKRDTKMAVRSTVSKDRVSNSFSGF